MVLWEVPMWQIRACSAWCWIISTTVFWYQDARTAQDSSNHLLPKHLRFPPKKEGLTTTTWLGTLAWWLFSIVLRYTRLTSKEKIQWKIETEVPTKTFMVCSQVYLQQKLQFSNIFPCHRIVWYCQRRIMWQQVDPICPVPTNRGLPHLPVIIRATTTALLELSSFACFLEIQIFLSGGFCPKWTPLTGVWLWLVFGNVVGRVVSVGDSPLITPCSRPEKLLQESLWHLSLTPTQLLSFISTAERCS